MSNSVANELKELSTRLFEEAYCREPHLRQLCGSAPAQSGNSVARLPNSHTHTYVGEVIDKLHRGLVRVIKLPSRACMCPRTRTCARDVASHFSTDLLDRVVVKSISGNTYARTLNVTRGSEGKEAVETWEALEQSLE